MSHSYPESGANNQQQSSAMKQANILPSGNGEVKTARQRASVACASCRDRRIRCVVPEGQLTCTQCERSETVCIIRNDDERRRPISKAYTSSLTNRIALLESMLHEKGADIPPANHPPKVRPERQNTVPSTIEQTRSDHEQQSSPGSGLDDFHATMNEPMPPLNEEIYATNSPPKPSPSKKDDLVHKLLSTRGHLSFDQLSGRLRFFGPTTNCHIYAEDIPNLVEFREPPEQVRRTERIIRSLSIETHDYLMSLFWDHYNSVIHVIHEGAFNEDRENSNNKYYSGFLHICILAMGYRYADRTREDMKKITLGDRECTLHREAKYMLDVELERPGGIPSVQAFLLLGDLECGVGRDNTGWMFAGMANRLCFDIGLHLDCKNDGLAELEVQIRHMTLLACVVYDKYWALFLGRPTGIKSSDLEMYHLSKQFASLGTCKPAGPEKALETRIYEELADLMELAGKIAEIRDHGGSGAEEVDNNAYLQVMDLDKKLQNWYRRLPDDLVWKPENINVAPFSFFLLHQQYHCSLILLHRPWARYLDDEQTNTEDSGGETDGFKGLDDTHSAMSRSICTRQAIRIARIFWHHRQRFDTRKIFVTGMQHAGTAATALVAVLASTKNIQDRQNNLQYLECLAGAVQDMAATFAPAQSMSSVLQAIMVEFRQANGKASPSSSIILTETSSIPARRESSSNNIEERQTFKKRQTTKASRRASEFARPASTSLPNFQNDRDPGPGDGYVMITPRSDTSAWPSLTADPNALDFPMTTFGMNMNADGMWMGAESMSPFPSSLSNGNMNNEAKSPNLDFFSFT